MHFGSATRRGNNLLHFLKPEARYDHKFWAAVFQSLNGQCYILPVTNSYKWVAKTLVGISECNNFEFTDVLGEVEMLFDNGTVTKKTIELKERGEKKRKNWTGKSKKKGQN